MPLTLPLDTSSPLAIVQALISLPTQEVEAHLTLLARRFPYVNWKSLLALAASSAVTNPAPFDNLLTSVVNTAVDTLILDVGVFASVGMVLQFAGGVPAAGIKTGLYAVDDAGNFMLVAQVNTIPAPGFIVGWGPGAGVEAVQGGLVFTLSPASLAVPAPLPRRIRVAVDAPGIGITTRLRIEGRR